MDPLYQSQPKTSGFCDIGTHQLYYEIRGRPVAGKVVMICGMGITCKFFDQLADKLSASFQVLTFNLRGVGESTAPRHSSGGASIKAVTEDTLALLDKIWPGEAVHVMGISMGGFVAQQLALLLLPSKRIKSLHLTVTTAHLSPRLLLPTWIWKLAFSFVPSDQSKLVKDVLKRNMGKDGYETPWTDQNGNLSTLGKLWEERWAREFSQWWCLNDKDVMARQLRACEWYRLKSAEAKILRESDLPIVVDIAPKDRLQATRLQKRLADLLNAEVMWGAEGHLGVVGELDKAAARHLEWLHRVVHNRKAGLV